MFRFVGGALCLDFVNTSSWTGENTVNDRLTSAEALFAWASEAKIPGVRKDGPGHLEPSASLVEDAHRLRVLLRRILVPLAHREEPLAAARLAFEREIKRALQASHLEPRDERLALVWPENAAGRGILERVTWSAFSLVRSPERARALRECEGSPCGWLFVDTSRNHLRRWCEMRTCGGVAKARAYRERNRV
ncbi:CGNR zinc finger domain-containing protein [Pendulispora albinea]|uniref:CGNR zinc finger domain-containing protein n=1 Tax=Pendulispora albinea TaxID=2741071 RepID=A0ABZ2LY64_9BACT